MLKKTILAAVAVTSLFCLAVPAAAETFTSSDGVLSINLPNENWKEIVDPTKWIVLSDGSSMLTVEHFSNGEKLPEITVADDHYVDIYQAAFSTQNEVFIITGSVADAADISDITNAILSAKVLKFDTKMAVKKEVSQPAADTFTVASMSATMYAAADVNVRSGYSTDDAVIGGLAAGSSVTVTGKVQMNGQDFGWYQVAYGSGTGYISGQFLTSTAPAVPEKKNEIVFTGNVKTVYSESGAALTLNEATDGYWYDSERVKYTRQSDYEFRVVDGNAIFTVNQPQSAESDFYAVGDAFTVYYLSGNVESLTLYNDGYYYSSGWVRYWPNGDETYTGADGSILFGYAPTRDQERTQEEVEEDDATETHYLEQVETGAGVTVSAGGGAFYDSDGTEYSWIEDGQMMDYYGNRYYVIW